MTVCQAPSPRGRLSGALALRPVDLMLIVQGTGRRLLMPFERIVDSSGLQGLFYGEGRLRQFQYHALARAQNASTQSAGVALEGRDFRR